MVSPRHKEPQDEEENPQLKKIPVRTENEYKWIKTAGGKESFDYSGLTQEKLISGLNNRFKLLLVHAEKIAQMQTELEGSQDYGKLLKLVMLQETFVENLEKARNELIVNIDMGSKSASEVSNQYKQLKQIVREIRQWEQDHGIGPTKEEHELTRMSLQLLKRLDNVEKKRLRAEKEMQIAQQKLGNSFASYSTNQDTVSPEQFEVFRKLLATNQEYEDEYSRYLEEVSLYLAVLTSLTQEMGESQFEKYSNRTDTYFSHADAHTLPAEEGYTSLIQSEEFFGVHQKTERPEGTADPVFDRYIFLARLARRLPSEKDRIRAITSVYLTYANLAYIQEHPTTVFDEFKIGGSPEARMQGIRSIMEIYAFRLFQLLDEGELSRRDIPDEMFGVALAIGGRDAYRKMKKETEEQDREMAKIRKWEPTIKALDVVAGTILPTYHANLKQKVHEKLVYEEILGQKRPEQNLVAEGFKAAGYMTLDMLILRFTLGGGGALIQGARGTTALATRWWAGETILRGIPPLTTVARTVLPKILLGGVFVYMQIPSIKNSIEVLTNDEFDNYEKTKAALALVRETLVLGSLASAPGRLAVKETVRKLGIRGLTEVTRFRATQAVLEKVLVKRLGLVAKNLTPQEAAVVSETASQIAMMRIIPENLPRITEMIKDLGTALGGRAATRTASLNPSIIEAYIDTRMLRMIAFATDVAISSGTISLGLPEGNQLTKQYNEVLGKYVPEGQVFRHFLRVAFASHNFTLKDFMEMRKEYLKLSKNIQKEMPLTIYILFCVDNNVKNLRTFMEEDFKDYDQYDKKTKEMISFAKYVNGHIFFNMLPAEERGNSYRLWLAEGDNLKIIEDPLMAEKEAL